jgi:diguanylate cyclase (GGDEF)-like protein
MFELFLLVVILSIMVLWKIEEHLQVIYAYDRIGYQISIVVLFLCFCISVFAKKSRLSRIFAFIYLTLYVLALTVVTFLQAAQTDTIYTVASTLQWLPIIYVIAFLFLPNTSAILSAIGIYLVILVLVYLAYSGIYPIVNKELKALILNAALSHAVYIFCMFGVVKLKQTHKASTLRAEQMEHAANIDGLLGIGNRRFLKIALKECANNKRRVSLLIADVDHFKAINDTHGHLVGDDVLRDISRCMESNLRPDDTFGRWGGEEFLVLARGASIASAESLAERIRLAVEEWEFPHVGKVTVSIGVAEYPQNSTESQAFSIADKALYEAKKAGRNRVVVAL